MEFRIFFSVILFCCIVNANAQQVKGIVTDEFGNPLPAVNVYIKNTTIGSTSGVDGKYRVELKQGTQTLVFRILGYETVEKEVVVTGNKPLELNVILKEQSLMLNEAVVYADRRDIAKKVMRGARDNRKKYLDALQKYSFHLYRKVSLQKEVPPEPKADTIGNVEKLMNIETSASADSLYILKTTTLREYYSKIYVSGNKFLEEIIAENEYKAERPTGSISVTMGVDSKGLNISNIGRQWLDPYIIFHDASSAHINFLNSTIHVPSISEQPILSPLAPTAPLSYVYDLEGVLYEDGIKLYKIKVTPLFSGDALVSGFIIIEDSTWALRGVDVIVNQQVLLFCKEFRIRQTYHHVNDSVLAPAKTEFDYIIKDGKQHLYGHIIMRYSQYEVNPVFGRRTFSNQIIKYNSNALNRDSAWWMSIRPVKLTTNEKMFAMRIDSLQKRYTSQAYIDSLDSAYNDINFWSFIIRGVGFRSSIRKSELYFIPLLAQLNPLGIGGYRHRFGGYYNKRFANDMFMETEGLIDYGFNNKDVRGKVGVGLTYIPERFVRTFIRFGDYYDMINDYASISSIFSRSNYVRTQTFSVAQRMEILNGLFGELTVTFSDQTPINNMYIEGWSNQLFGELNKPLDFERYKKLDLRLELKFRPNQKYIMKGKQKFILETNMPEFSMVYRKGIPQIFGSEVNYDFLEIGAHDEMKLARWGTSNWAVLVGSFLNRKSLRIIEHRYFRGSDMYFFSDPLQSFQLLGATLSSSTAYFRANYMHHFEGALTNKVPLLNKLKIGLAGGGGILMMEESNFRHAEIFAGIERTFRIRKQLFRIGIFGVTADDNLSKARITYKVGINFYNPFTKKWDY